METEIMEGTSLIEDIIRLRYNPFTLAPVLMAFYSNCHVPTNSVILYSVILPLITSKKWLAEVQRVRRDSKLSHWVKDDSLPLSGLLDRVEAWRGLSPAALQYCIDREWASIDENNNVVVSDQFEPKIYEKEILFSNAKKLGVLFGDNTVENILLSLGIREI